MADNRKIMDWLLMDGPTQANFEAGAETGIYEGYEGGAVDEQYDTGATSPTGYQSWLDKEGLQRKRAKDIERILQGFVGEGESFEDLTPRIIDQVLFKLAQSQHRNITKINPTYKTGLSRK